MKPSLTLSAIALLVSSSLSAQEVSEIDILRTQIKSLENKVQQLEQSSDSKALSETIATELKKKSPITVGGTVRFQYAWTDYDEDSKDRNGDLDFDVFRLDLNGEIGGIILSAQYRWYGYMNVLHHAWVGYKLDENNTVKAGISQIPFGILPYASHNFFFTSGFYIGLEDDYDAGLSWTYDDGEYRFDVGYYLNDEQGGIDGYVSSRSDRYSYDVLGIRLAGEGTWDAPSAEIAESNTLNLRASKKFTLDENTTVEAGLSYQIGELSQGGDITELGNNAVTSTHLGEHSAWAFHTVIDWTQLNVQLQYAGYEYEIDGFDVEQMVVGAFAFHDSIPAEADSWSANVAWSQPVSYGPVSNITFYNDYSRITNKSGGLDDTWMNVTGMMITSGGLYTYIDYICSENQPFVNGTVVGNDSETNKRLNINVGFYF